MDVARFQSNPTESRHTDVKRIIKYISTNPKLGLLYLKGSDFIFIRYLDVDFAGYRIDRKSTLRACQMMNCMLIS